MRSPAARRRARDGGRRAAASRKAATLANDGRERVLDHVPRGLAVAEDGRRDPLELDGTRTVDAFDLVERRFRPALRDLSHHSYDSANGGFSSAAESLYLRRGCSSVGERQQFLDRVRWFDSGRGHSRSRSRIERELPANTCLATVACAEV